ncbi:MAG: hypothetical protein ABSG68_22695 [Thermoguttaceae bacterium]|jgi:hypothetical protein
MTKKANFGKRAEVKLALARKYARLAKTVSSRPRSQTWLRLSARHQRQAEDLLRMQQQAGS